MNQKNCTDMFGIRKLKQEIDQLRNDMAAEFVKRDKVIEAHTTHLETFHKLVEGWAKDLGDLEKRLKNTEEYVGMQTDSIAAIILACGLREENKFNKAHEQIERERADLKKMIDQAKGKYEAPKVEKIEATKPEAEPALEAEETLFSGLDEYIDSAEARQMLGWKSLSTTMLRRMNIRYQQPKGRYHRLTVHKGDCEKFISNRIVRKKKN